MAREAAPTSEETPALGAESLDEARSLVGVKLRRGDQQWNRYADPDTVRHFAWGIGDENPLYCDEDYGATSSWGTGLAPGCYLYSVDSTIVAPKLPGVQWIYTGTDWEWYRPIPHRECFTTEVTLVDAVMKEGRNASRFIIQTGECRYLGADGGLVARALGHTARIPRKRAEGGMSYTPREPYRYSSAELADIEEAILAEELRGATPRYWQDVSVGDAVPPVVKGPLTTTDMICFYATYNIYKAHERGVRYRRNHPRDSYVDPRTGVKDHPARGHVEPYMASEVGMPGVYDIGPQRISWMANALTNWMGDDGFMSKLSVRLDRPNLLGDTVWCDAVVTAVEPPAPEADERARRGVVHLDLKCENQLGDVISRGTAEVELPDRHRPGQIGTQ